MVHQSLYLRYRPGRFAEVVGQEHVVAALRNAVAGDRVGHAYLFSGPRGTGKTSTARILAKALNCENVSGGEPCGACATCGAIAGGTSYELHELDAASNNKVDDVRDLISRVAIGTPGRVKVYVLDEVHMLTSGAENALLKTLEEPPPHVVFVLCTTEPHKVAQTIRSRTQHLRFELLDADLLDHHVRAVAADAGLEVSDADLAYVIATGGGSARDTLSALDATAAAGRSPSGADSLDGVLEALATGDTAAALAAADAAARAGREPRTLGEALMGRLRSAFLAAMGAPLDYLPAAERAAAAQLAERLRPRTLTYALELLGAALVAMREAPDPRVDLDLVLVRLTSPAAGVTLQSLAERVERLEAGPAAPGGRHDAGGPPGAPSGPAPRGPAAAPADPRPRRGGDAAGVRDTLAQRKPPEPPAPGGSPSPGGGPRRQPSPARAAGGSGAEDAPAAPPARAAAPRATAAVAAPAAAAPPAAPSASAAPPAAPPDRDEVVLAWADEVLPSLSVLPKGGVARLATGRFLANSPAAVRLGFRTPGALQGCESFRPEVEAAFGHCFDRPVTVEFTIDDGSTPDFPTRPPPGAAVPSRFLGQIAKAPQVRPVQSGGVDLSGVEQMQRAFPGSRLVDLEAT